MIAETINACEAARLLGVRVDEIYRLCVSGKLKAAKAGDKHKRWRISKAAVEQRAAAKRDNGREA